MLNSLLDSYSLSLTYLVKDFHLTSFCKTKDIILALCSGDVQRSNLTQSEGLLYVLISKMKESYNQKVEVLK